LYSKSVFLESLLQENQYFVLTVSQLEEEVTLYQQMLDRVQAPFAGSNTADRLSEQIKVLRAEEELEKGQLQEQKPSGERTATLRRTLAHIL